MELRDAESKAGLVNRLRRIEGQVRGVENMINSERECREVLQQLLAVRSAVQGATQAFAEAYLRDCLVRACSPDNPDYDELVDDLLLLLGKSTPH